MTSDDIDPATRDRILSIAKTAGQARKRRRREAASAGIALLVVGGVIVTTNLLLPARDRGSASLTTSTSPSPATSFDPSVTPSGSPSSPAASTGACQAIQVTLTPSDLSGAGGSMAARLVIHNTSTVACTLAGYPSVVFKDASGRQTAPSVPTSPGQYVSSQLGRAPSPSPVTLQPNSDAVAWLGWQDNGAQSTCITPTLLTFVPPNSSATSIEIPGPFNTVVCSDLVSEPIQPAQYHPNVPST